MESLALGLRARLIRGRALHLADGAGGAALIAAVALGLIWVFGAVALHAPGTAQLRGDVQRSLILRSLNDLLPPSGPVLNALNRVDPAPSIAGPTTPLRPPDPAIAARPRAWRGASRSVVRVLGTACGLGVEGSGWVGRAGAGRHQRPRGRRRGRHHGHHLRRRLARSHAGLLRPVQRPRHAAGRAPLPRWRSPPTPSAGTAGAVLGYPENGPYAVAPPGSAKPAR